MSLLVLYRQPIRSSSNQGLCQVKKVTKLVGLSVMKTAFGREFDTFD